MAICATEFGSKWIGSALIENRPSFPSWPLILSFGLMIAGIVMLAAFKAHLIAFSLVTAGAALGMFSATVIQLRGNGATVPASSRFASTEFWLTSTTVLIPYVVSFWLPAVEYAAGNIEGPRGVHLGWQAAWGLIVVGIGFFPIGILIAWLVFANPCLWMAIFASWQQRFQLAAFWSGIATALSVTAGIWVGERTRVGYYCWLGSILAMLTITLIASLWKMWGGTHESKPPRRE